MIMMNTFQYLHWFTAGLFVSAVLSQNTLIATILAILLITTWGDYILPLFSALFIDVTFTDVRTISNLFGFMFTAITLVLIVFFLSLRKFLKF